MPGVSGTSPGPQTDPTYNPPAWKADGIFFAGPICAPLGLPSWTVKVMSISQPRSPPAPNTSQAAKPCPFAVKVCPQTFAQKALARAAGLAAVEVGQVVDARPDIVLSHDNTAAIRRIWQQFGQERVVIPERIAITLDHAVPAPTTRHAQNHAEIRAFVQEQGIGHFFEV